MWGLQRLLQRTMHRGDKSSRSSRAVTVSKSSRGKYSIAVLSSKLQLPQMRWDELYRQQPLLPLPPLLPDFSPLPSLKPAPSLGQAFPEQIHLLPDNEPVCSCLNWPIRQFMSSPRMSTKEGWLSCSTSTHQNSAQMTEKLASPAHSAAETGGDGVSNAHSKETKRQINSGSSETTLQQLPVLSLKISIKWSSEIGKWGQVGEIPQENLD